jgi:peroxiredoxin
MFTTSRAIRVSFVAIAVVSVISLVWAEGLSVGTKAPAFTLKTLAGKPYRLADYRGKSVVVLDFGRFTCLPCRSVIQDLQKLQLKYRGKGVQIFSINLDGAMAARVVPKGIQELQVTFPVLLDTDGKVCAAYKVETIPHLVVIDRQGKVRYAHTGYEPDMRARLSQQIDKYRAK